MWSSALMEPCLNQAVSCYSDNGSLASTSVSASTKCTLPGLPPLGGTMAQSTLTSGTYSEAVTFVPSPQTCMTWVSRPPLPGGRYPAVYLCLEAHSPRIEAPVRSEHPITLQNELRPPINNQCRSGQYSPPGHPGLVGEPS